MPNYDFLNLSPPEFEELTRDLLQKHLNIIFESFTNGKDNGIDFRHSVSEKEDIIIQCKRFKDFKSLISSLKKEKESVVKLSPKQYIISTSVGLTPNQKNIIYNLFSPYIKNTIDIYGRDDLNNLLSIHDKIEAQHFKLWLSSSNVLDKILHSKIYNQSSFEIEQIKETINLYVDNESYHNAVNIINDKKYVIISGIPGVGKTTLARILIFKYLAYGFEEFIYLSDTINDAFTIFQDGKKQIFLFDDFLGTNFLENKLSNNEEQRIVRFIDKISKSNDKIIIFTTREYILAQAKQKYDAFNNSSLDFAKCVIDLSQYTKLVKAKILYNHLYFSNLPSEHILSLIDNQNYQKIINHKNYNPRIIETITNDNIWKTIDAKDFSSKFLAFIENPESVWKHVYENQISNLSQIILANLMTTGSPILLDEIKSIVQNFAKQHYQKYGLTYSEIEFKKSIKELENTFVKISKDENNIFRIEYQNPSVQDFLVFYFRDLADYINDILEISTHLNQLFNIFSFEEDFDYIISNRILLNNDQKKIVVKKILNNFDTLTSTSLKGSYRNFEKENFSNYIKLNQIIRQINIHEFSELKQSLILKFKAIMFPEPFQLSSEEIICYINIFEKFKNDMEFDSQLVLYHVSESIIDKYDFEEFEKFEKILGNEYLEIVSMDERHRSRINTLLELEVENTYDDLEDLRDDIVQKAQKYRLNCDYLNEKINRKILNKKDNEEGSFNFFSDNAKKIDEDRAKEDIIIKNIFDSLK